jgi:hypothetical protein
VAGFPHPDFLLERLTAQQWAECLEYYALEPFGPTVDDVRHGMQCATMLAPYMKKGQPANPHHFMIRPPDPPELTTEQTKAFFRAALGGGDAAPTKKD